MSPHLIFRPIKYGYYRIYWRNGGEPAYLHEVYKWMPHRQYELEFKDPNLVDKRYYDEYHDQIDLTRRVKNYVEGYTDAIETLRTRLFMLRNNKEFRSEATKAYRHVRIK